MPRTCKCNVYSHHLPRSLPLPFLCHPLRPLLLLILPPPAPWQPLSALVVPARLPWSGTATRDETRPSRGPSPGQFSLGSALNSVSICTHTDAAITQRATSLPNSLPAPPRRTTPPSRIVGLFSRNATFWRTEPNWAQELRSALDPVKSSCCLCHSAALAACTRSLSHILVAATLSTLSLSLSVRLLKQSIYFRFHFWLAIFHSDVVFLLSTLSTRLFCHFIYGIWFFFLSFFFCLLVSFSRGMQTLYIWFFFCCCCCSSIISFFFCFFPNVCAWSACIFKYNWSLTYENGRDGFHMELSADLMSFLPFHIAFRIETLCDLFLFSIQVWANLIETLIMF